MDTRIEFNFLNKSSEEILEYLISVVKQYCLEAEWKELEEVFVEFYTLYEVEQKRNHIEKCKYEASLVIKLLNNLYVRSYMAGREDIARKIAIKVGDRCDHYSHLTF